MRRTIHPYVRGIATELLQLQNKSNAVAMKQYMRNQFLFFGIPSGVRRSRCNQYMSSRPLPDANELRTIVMQLWEQKERELHYFAIELLIKCKRVWSERDAEFFEVLITKNSWWDTIDFLAGHVVGPWLKLYPRQVRRVTQRWNRSENIWLQRMSLLFQLKYKKDTDTKLLSAYIKNLHTSNEFFIQKAIGWILREYSKTNPQWVMDFVSENELKPLSKREALKVINRKKLL